MTGREYGRGGLVSRVTYGECQRDPYHGWLSLVVWVNHHSIHLCLDVFR